MKKNFYSLSLFSFLFSCSSSNLDIKVAPYKSFITNGNYQPAKITNQKNETSYLEIDSLKAYQQDVNSQNIKSDFKFQLENNSGLSIDKVLLSESKKQVDQNGADFIVADYSNNKTINLTITGKFPEEGFEQDNFFFINEPNLLSLTYTGDEKPKTKVLLDDGIILQPISSSKSYINVSINSKNIPDLYLIGLHKLKIISGNKTASIMVRIDNPIKPLVSLSPLITKIEILKKDNDKEKSKDKDNKPRAISLKLTGFNFMLQPKLSYTLVDGVFSPGYITDIISTPNGDVWETVINISAQTNFFTKTSHTLDYYTPFGLNHLEFNNQGQ